MQLKLSFCRVAVITPHDSEELTVQKHPDVKLLLLHTKSMLR